MVKRMNQPVMQLKESDRDIIGQMLTIIADRYPQAHERLMQIYSASSRNRSFYEFKAVHRFIRCNFGNYDQYEWDVNHNGLFRFEDVKCPLRGECVHEGIICRPKINNKLSERELEVFRFIADGYSADEIAQHLYISPCTVIRHRRNIEAKLGLHSIAELVKYWSDNHLE